MKKPPASTFVNFNDNHSNQLIQNLVTEISEIEHKLSKLHCDKQSVDFSMEQTYKEMLHSRRGMRDELQRQQQGPRH